MKKKIIFFSTPAFGHILAEYPIIKKLIDEGYNVDWYATEQYRNIVEKSGANFKIYKEKFDGIYNLANVTSNFYNLMDVLLKLNRQCFIDYIDEIEKEKVSLVLYDSMCSFAKNIAQKINVKSICLCSTFAYNFFTFTFSNMLIPSIKLIVKNLNELIKMIHIEKKFRKENNIKKLNILDLFVNRGDITIVLTLKELQPFVKTFPKSFKFVGTTIKDKICIKKQEYSNDYDIYISLGSIFPENSMLIEQIMNHDYFKNKRTIINTGKLNINSNNKNIELVNYTDQLELLKKCKLFINHAGINSIYDSISCGVPQMCIPQQEEQRMNAKIISRKKIGYYMKNFDFDKIKKIQNKIKAYNKNINKYKNLINNTDGTKEAVRLIREAMK